jgi:molybdopterin synthase catalytic subunit
MRVTVRLFAILRDTAGTDHLSIELADGASVSRAMEQVGERLPSLASWLPRVAPAVNREYAARDATLHDGDELALIPPVSGGTDGGTDAGADQIAIEGQALSVEWAVRFVTDARAGGIDVFLGTTRAETTEDGRELVALDYEAYEAMAIGQMRQLAARAREQWPIVKLAILHRVGRVAVGEPSVIIAVASPHRAESFEACRFLIDSLKAEVAIWKKEAWGDGSGSWVHPSEGC